MLRASNSFTVRNLTRCLKVALFPILLSMVLSNFFLFARPPLVQRDLEKIRCDNVWWGNAVYEMKKGNQIFKGSDAIRVNQTVFLDNKTHIYWFYCTTCSPCIRSYQEQFSERLPIWVSNVSSDAFEAGIYNTKDEGQELAKRVLSAVGIPVSQVTSISLNNIIILNNFEGFVFLPSDPDDAIRETVNYLVKGGDQAQDGSSFPFGSVLTLVVVSGLLDSINPCAFSVLLFSAAFLFITSRTSIEKTQRRILLVESIYILGIYLAYLIIGLGIVRAFTMTPFPHLFGKIGAVLVISLGVLNIKDHFWPGRRFSLRMSTSQWGAVRRWMRKSTVPSMFVAGFLVSLFEFPCTGGIYVAILGLLAKKTTFTQGFIYLSIYNAAFIVPLMVLLVFVSRRKVMEFSLERWQRHHGGYMRLLLGSTMVFLGTFLLFSGLV